MDIKELESQGLLRKYTLNALPEELKKSLDEEAQEISKVAEIPGFRAGKVPASMIKTRYADRLKVNAIEKFLSEGLKQIREGKPDLMPLGDPKVNIEHFGEDQGFAATLEFEIFPEFSVDFAGIKLVRRTAEHNEEDLNKLITRLQTFQASLNPLKDEALKEGRVASIELKIFPATKAKESEALYDQAVYVKVGEPFMKIKDFSENLLDAKAGEEKEFSITAPEDCAIKNCGGKKIKCHAKIKEVYEQTLASVDDVARNFGFDNAESFRSNMAAFMPKHVEDTSKKLLEHDLVEAINKAISNTELPKNALGGEIDFVKNNMKKEAGETEEKIEELAKKRLALSLFLGRIIRKEELRATAGEVLAMFNRANPGRQVRTLQDVPERQVEMLERNVLTQKAFDFVLSKADVQENKISCDELFELYRNTLLIPNS